MGQELPTDVPDSLKTETPLVTPPDSLKLDDDQVMLPDSLVLTSKMSDEAIIARLEALNPYFSLPFNPVVRNYIVSYSERKGKGVKLAMGRSAYYFPIIEEILRNHSLPLELKYLAVVESKLNPTARSRAGATGMWQFMYRTALLNGLVINSYVDERMDVVKSTEAAARHLTKLYEMFGDWPLAISAYNCGSGNVRKAISLAGGKSDFWSVYKYLPRETRGYMPAFVGMMYAFEYAGDSLKELYSLVAMPEQVDTFQIRHNLHFKQISETTGVPLDEIEYYNPQYYNKIIPGDSGVCTLILPEHRTEAYMAVPADSLYHYKADIFFSQKVIRDLASGASSSGARHCHVVKEGETLSHIASRYGVKVKSLMSWNHLKSDRLRIGQKIYIY